MADESLLKSLPSVDEALKSPQGQEWLSNYPRRFVLEAVRAQIALRREMILEGKSPDVTLEGMSAPIERTIAGLSSLSLKRVINATGIVVHTNLGRSALSEVALDNVRAIASGYSNLEYDLATGRRGKRYSHLKRLLMEVTGAEDGIAVNNNAAAVLVCLNSLARGREVIVSRGELVEIGGSFRVPDVMAQSGCILREVGTTNKTHLRDYESAVNERTALILKVHQSNYRITGFAQDVPLGELVGLGRRRSLPVMYDLGSGCLIDLRPYGIQGEPPVRETVETGADVLTFSGDKLLGGPQAGVIVGKKYVVEAIQTNPLLRALRIDKLTLAALEATLMAYAEPESAMERVPTLRMLLEEPSSVRRRARRIAALINKGAGFKAASVSEDVAYSGGGALPEHGLKTYVVVLKAEGLSPNTIEERLRLGDPPVIGRIREDSVLLDARTVLSAEVPELSSRAVSALRDGQS